MSRGKSLVDDAIGAVWCQEAEIEEARELLDALADEGLASFRGAERLGPGAVELRPRLERIHDAIAAFERAIGFEYRK